MVDRAHESLVDNREADGHQSHGSALCGRRQAGTVLARSRRNPRWCDRHAATLVTGVEVDRVSVAAIGGHEQFAAILEVHDRDALCRTGKPTSDHDPYSL